MLADDRDDRQDSSVPPTEFLDALPDGTPRHDERPAGMHDGCDCGGDADTSDPWRRGFTRRRMVQGSSAMVAALGLQTVSTRYAFAADAAAKKLNSDCVVVISTRGGWDSLSIVAPVNEDNYYKQRPNIAIPKGAALPLARGFGFHPALTELHKLYGAGKVAPVVGVGTLDRTLSHFEAMDSVERATPTAGASSGWLNRLLEARGDNGVFSAVQMGSSLPLALAGDAPALTMTGVQSFGLMGFDDVKAKAATAFAGLYKGMSHPLAVQVRDTVSAIGKIGAIKPTADAVAKTYPGGGFGDALKDVARLVKAKLGLTVATLDVGGWDMHTNLGKVDGGDMLNHMKEMDQALSAFVKDLGDDFANVTIVMISEFGRTVRENGAIGTDHGHGQAMIVMGGGIKGGNVYGTWPGLDDKSLFINGSVAGPTDYRAVLSEVLTKRADVGSVSKVFPGYKPKLLGLANAR